MNRETVDKPTQTSRYVRLACLLRTKPKRNTALLHTCRVLRVGYTIVWSGIHECNEYIPLQAMV